ncbi:chromosome segregation protein SMC [Chakrabartyella piscis]|uniref:chromosome segregation protein SMC n=1 Tax=Chakrabartyella piscis TaxID=2918914 RepID=UPI0029583E1B|nr:chromosome segregation protein SMC [Chakrabartyella piscis]
MYLKRLDLQGFKSFPEKVKLDFNTGVTAVVGPNGSGKSNVSDAVRWVLGEQRAKSLRGDKMEDIIFAGTENRKPLGFAEVSITIDNTDERLPLDFSEVQVTRRVFRSGESEYRINGAACRLRDIQELFMDTGIGREGYSIIGQGRIDELLSAKGDERRRVFEEATGIVKYRTRRNETIHKLEKEQQNLIRVDDIIGELEVQVEPLEKQSQKAKEYLALKEELKQSEVVAYHQDLDALEVLGKQLEADKKLAVEQMETYQTQSVKSQTTTTQLKSELEALDLALESKNQELLELRTEKERTEGTIRLVLEQQQNESDHVERVRLEIAELEQKKQENKEQLDLQSSKKVALQMELGHKESDLQELQNKYEQLGSAVDADELRAEGFKEEVFEQIRISTEVRGEIAKREALKEQFANRLEQVDGEKDLLESRLHQLEIHLQADQKNETTMTEEIQFLEDEMVVLEKDREHIQVAEKEMQNKLDINKKRLSDVESRLSVLVEMEKEHDGFYHSVKSLLQLHDRERRGICGAVGQLLQVEAEYEIAIEAALGATLQNVVTKTEEDARDAISYLKQRKLGRATFLPISAIKGRTFEGYQPILEEDGVIGVAHELVSFDELYRQIALYVLGRTIIVDTLENAVKLAKKYNHKFRMVTLQGDIMNVGGSMTGGSAQKKATHIFGRGREIESLQKDAKTLQITVSHLAEEMESFVEEMEDVETQLVAKKMETQTLWVKIQGIKEEQKKTIVELEETKERLQLFVVEFGQLEEQLSMAEGDIAKGQKTLQEAEDIITKANMQLTSFQGTLTEEKEKREQILQEMTQMKIDVSGIAQNLEHMTELIATLEKDNESVTRQQEKGEESILSYQQKGVEKGLEEADLRAQVQKLEETIQSVEMAMFTDSETKVSCNQELQEQEENLLNLRESASKMENELFRLDTKMEKAEEEKLRLTTTLWEEYEMTYRMAKEYAEYAKTLPESRSVKELRGKIRGLGDVNVGAIDQYKEVVERYEFLTSQRADIIEAEGKLNGIIEELTGLMEKQFKDQFQLISANFSRVFGEMFGGGKAYLKLADWSRALESPIEIVAQPPGKNLQNMQLLSGGERALTAIAILFAILQMKPSPFCILDEIEAALDDANVVRYAKYLKQFAKETQFIVITHRKGTMEYADVLYGVTMQEKGISKLISVDFSESEQFVS